VIEELIRLAKEMREADRRGEDLGLTDDEVTFYDALETNDSAVEVLGDENPRKIARERRTSRSTDGAGERTAIRPTGRRRPSRRCSNRRSCFQKLGLPESDA
jgi:type I site-specific restriction-modification system R (restriction) subunit